MATGQAERDPSSDLRDALLPAMHEHYASIAEPEKIGGLPRALGGYEGSSFTMRIAPCMGARDAGAFASRFANEGIFTIDRSRSGGVRWNQQDDCEVRPNILAVP